MSHAAFRMRLGRHRKSLRRVELLQRQTTRTAASHLSWFAEHTLELAAIDEAMQFDEATHQHATNEDHR